MDCKIEDIRFFLETKLSKELISDLYGNKTCRKVVLSKKQVLSTYLLRYKIYEQNKKGKKFYGYEELLKSLELFSQTNVAVYSIIDDNSFFLFFTDTELTNLIGYISNKIL